MQLDYGAIIQAGMNSVPDLRAQRIEDALLKQQNTVFQQQQEVRAAQIEAARQAQAKEGEFRSLFDNAMMRGDARSALALRNRFPELAKKYEEVFNALDEDQKRGDITQMGSIYARAQAGDFTGAASIIRGRIDADRAAGQDTADDEQILAGLESEDPIQRNAAMGTVAFVLASVQPKEFAATYGQLSKPDAKTTLEREYEFNVRTYGKAYADQVVASKNTDRIAVNPGGSVFEAGPQMPATQGGGDPSGSGAGMEMGSFWSFFDLEGPQGVAERTKASPVRVRSQQDVAALPKGAHFIDPRDGVTVRVKP